LEHFLEWGRSGADWQCLKYGLQKAHREELLPPKPVWQERPLCWWDALRQDLSKKHTNFMFPLSLGNLYRFIYPDDNTVLGKWHNAGVDVLMTMRLIHVYFCRMGRSPIPYKLDSYFTPVCPNESGERSDATFAEYSATVRDSLEKRLSSRMNELLADIERQTQWEMDLEDDSVKYQDVERLAEEHWGIADSDFDDGDVETEQTEYADIYLEHMDLEDLDAEDMGL